MLPYDPSNEDEAMPLFEIETASHIIITWSEDETAAIEVVKRAIRRSRRSGLPAARATPG